jgi:hypothetical protein
LWQSKAEAGFRPVCDAIQGDSSRAVVRVKLPLLEELKTCPEKALKSRTRSRSCICQGRGGWSSEMMVVTNRIVLVENLCVIAPGRGRGSRDGQEIQEKKFFATLKVARELHHVKEKISVHVINFLTGNKAFIGPMLKLSTASQPACHL